MNSFFSKLSIQYNKPITPSSVFRDAIGVDAFYGAWHEASLAQASKCVKFARANYEQRRKDGKTKI